tara:strand:- start:4457 stop:6259 length:1803 start_codon:yes stop_codon:yes gene_type:complete
MNFKNLFNNRNKNFARLSEAGDYLGRRLRENLVIYDIDDTNHMVTYVTECQHLVSCKYQETKGKLTFDDFVVENLEKITSDEAIDEHVEQHIHTFMEAIVVDRFDVAEVSFDSVIESFKMRSKIEESRKKLNKKIARFGETYNIKETKAYRKFEESLPLLQAFFAENLEALQSNPKLIEGLRLSKVVGDTYDLPKLTLETLKDEFVVIPTNSKKTLYEMVCEKELVRKELLEAKESFSRMWAKNDRLSTLASHIYSHDTIIKKALVEAVHAVPYIALSNKVDLTAVLDSVFQVTNPGSISQKDIREFVGKIYEFKKPMKSVVLQTLNEKYGVNVQSLRFIPSFKGLAEVQSEIFSMLAENAGDGILSDVLKEFSVCMTKKGGVQVLDVANTLSHVMSEANFAVVDIDETFQMKKLSDYLKSNIDDAQYYGDDDELSNDPGLGSEKKKGKKGKDWGGDKGDIKAKDRKKDDDSKLTADEEGDVDDDKSDAPGDKLTKKQSKKMDKDKDGDIDAKDMKKLRKEGAEAAEEEVETDEVEDEEVEDTGDEQMNAAEKDMEGDNFRKLVARIEGITDDIDVDLEDDEEDEVDEAEESAEEEKTEE